MKIRFSKTTADIQEGGSSCLQDIFLWLERQFFDFDCLLLAMLSDLFIKILEITQKGCKGPSGDLAIAKRGIGFLLPTWLLVLGLEAFSCSLSDGVPKSNEFLAVSSTPEQICFFVNFCIHYGKFLLENAI